MPPPEEYSFLDRIFWHLDHFFAAIPKYLTSYIAAFIDGLEIAVEQISKTAVGLWNTARDLYREQWAKRSDKWADDVRKTMKETLIEGGASEDVADRIVDETLDNPYYLGGVTLIPRLFIGAMLAVKSSLFAFIPYFNRMHASRYRPELLGPADAILIHRRNEAETRPDFKVDFDLLDELANQGYSNDRITGLLAAAYNPLPWPDVLRLHAGGLLDDELLTRFSAWHNVDDVSLEQVHLWEHRPLDFNTVLPFVWRDIYGHDEALNELALAGWNPTQAEGLLQLSELIPAPPDLVRMAVREVFTPEIAEEFGQFEGLPEAFVEHMGKQGFSEMWAKYYWGAHWELPSIQMGFQMLHRDEIKMPQLDFLLRALDVMPRWREPLKNIAYRLLTRVDVRRMHKTGVISLDEVHKAYRYLGYNPDDADLMTAFTAEYNAQADRDLSKSEILKAYRSRILLQEQAIEMLVELGYDDESVAVLIVQVDLDRHKATHSTKAKHIRKLYDAHIIDYSEAVTRLTALPTDGNEALELVSIWTDERVLAEAAEIVPDSLPSKGDLTAFIKAGVMGKIGWTQVMKWRKYAPSFIEAYWQTLPEDIRTMGDDYDGDNAELSGENAEGSQG